MHFRQHNRWVLGLAASALAALSTLSGVVDPVGLWDAPVVRGFNSFKARQHQYEHAYKAHAYAERPAPAIFLGTSRIKYGLQAAAYARLTGRAAYNLGVGGMGLDAHRALLDHARFHRPDLAEAVIGVGHHDLLVPSASSLARAREASRRLASSWPPFRDLARHTLTLTALQDAVATVAASRRDPDDRAYSPEGHDLRQPYIASLERSGVRAALRNSVRTYAKRDGVLTCDPAQLARLRDLVAACRAAGVALTVFVPPIHALEYEGSWGSPSWDVIERGKRELAAITPYWDFSGYNAVTTEPLADHMRNYLDVTHFRPAVGDLVFARMYGGGAGVPPGFGRLVTAATVEASLAALRAERAAWAASKPADLAFLAALRREYGAR